MIFLHGLSIPQHHQHLLTKIRALTDHLLPQTQVSLLKTKGHSGHEGNERAADTLAKRGFYHASNIGRHSPPIRSPLSETIMFKSSPKFEALSLEEQAITLHKVAMKAVPRTKDQPYKKEYLSEPTKRFIN